MLQDPQNSIELYLARFFNDLTTWAETGHPFPVPQSLDLKDDELRLRVLPFAVLATRNNDRHQDIAELIDRTIAGFYATFVPANVQQHSTVIAELEEAFEALCYVGFRRARIVSAPTLRDVIYTVLERQHWEREDELTKDDFRYLMSALALCKARLDTEERHGYAYLCEEILHTIREHGQRHIKTDDVYKIVRWFRYPGKLQPRSLAPLSNLAFTFGKDYFDAKRYYVPSTFRAKNAAERLLFIASDNARNLASRVVKLRKNNPGNVVKDVAIATAIGRPQYGMAVIDYLQYVRNRSSDKVFRGRMQTRMVEVSYVAGADEIYGLWNNTYKRFLLNNKFNTYSNYIIATLQRFGRYERSLKVLTSRKRSTLQGLNAEAMLLRYMSRFEQARAVYDNLTRHAHQSLLERANPTPGKPAPDKFRLMSLFWPTRTRDELEYILAVKKRLEAARSKGTDGPLIVLCPASFTAFTQIPIHALEELKRRSSSIISLTPGYIVSDAVSDDIDKNVSNSIYPHYYTDRTSMAKKPSDGWDVDIDAKKIVFRGVNFFHTIHNTMGIIFRRYDVEWQEPIVRAHVERYQTAAEAMFDKHDRILEYCRATGRKAKLVLTEIQHGLSHSLRLIAEHSGSRDHIEIFHVCNGFESYHDNLERSQSAQFQCISNLTRHPDVSLAYRPAVEVFEEWHATASDSARRDPAAIAYAEKIGSQVTTLRYPGELRFPGGPVIVLLGKILPDLPRPNDVGFIHADVKEWFLDCCRFAHDNGVNLLVKPHPAEHNSQVSLYVNQEFTDFLCELPEEIRPVVLDRFAFPVTGLREMVDGVIMWGGNSPVELGLLEIPSMICGYYGARDCPVGHYLPETRQQFEEFMLGKIDRSRLPSVREKTISFLSYSLSPHHTIPSRFNNRSLYNAEVWPPILYDRSEETDRYGSLMADYILGNVAAIVPPTS